jgi:iron complex transport system ATP-binding protein
MDVMLAAERLAFGYRGVPIGYDIDLAVERGEVLCLLGPNGSGKTTLFKTLLGLLPAQGGRVSIAGRPLGDYKPAELAQRVAYVPQAHGAFFPFTVRDVVLMGRAARIGLFASPGRHDRDAADAALATLGIGHLAPRVYTEISGGERQMALIARALAQEPAVLVMDEPTANLDFGNQARVLACIRRLADRGLAIVLSTHDPDHAFACATRVALLHGGKIVAAGRPETTVTPANLKRLYGVDVAIVYLDEVGRHVCTPSLSVSKPGEPS